MDLAIFREGIYSMVSHLWGSVVCSARDWISD